ncbi:MAG: NAD(P)-binding domain-containing protein [Holophaga sp.]|nr:NAD(P)-binding domain-containing protein [Holophaga sp.]
MRIGIIGAGLIGRAVARLAVAQGHEVMVSNSRGPETLASLASGLGCKAGTVEQAEAFGDLVVVAIPLKHCLSIPVAPLIGKVVLDANNYYPDRDGRIAELDARMTTTSELLARHLPQSRIVKAFNAILATDLEKDGRPAGSPGRRALPIAGDDAKAKAVAAHFVDQLGFDPLDAGALAESWRFERAKPAYCIPLDLKGLRNALDAAERNVELPDGSWRQ